MLISSRSLLLSVGLAGALFICTGCKPPPPPPIVEQAKDYNTPLPAGQMALVKLTDPAQFPDFSEGFNHRPGLERACQYNLEYLSKKSSEGFYP